MGKKCTWALSVLLCLLLSGSAAAQRHTWLPGSKTVQEWANGQWNTIQQWRYSYDAHGRPTREELRTPADTFHIQYRYGRNEAGRWLARQYYLPRMQGRDSLQYNGEGRLAWYQAWPPPGQPKGAGTQQSRVILFVYKPLNIARYEGISQPDELTELWSFVPGAGGQWKAITRIKDSSGNGSLIDSISWYNWEQRLPAAYVVRQMAERQGAPYLRARYRYTGGRKAENITGYVEEDRLEQAGWIYRSRQEDARGHLQNMSEGDIAPDGSLLPRSEDVMDNTFDNKGRLTETVIRARPGQPLLPGGNAPQDAALQNYRRYLYTGHIKIRSAELAPRKSTLPALDPFMGMDDELLNLW